MIERGILGKPASTSKEITKSSTTTLLASELRGSIINNYEQGAPSTLTLCAAVAGLSGTLVISATGNAVHLKAGASDKIYLDSVALDDADKVSNTVPAVGDYITFWTFRTGATTYDWLAVSGNGVWTDGGA